MYELPAQDRPAYVQPQWKFDLYAEESVAATRSRLHQVIRSQQCQGRKPALLQLDHSSIHAAGLLKRLRGKAVEVPQNLGNYRLLVLPVNVLADVLRPLGRRVWGINFDLHLDVPRGPSDFPHVILWEDKVRIRDCWLSAPAGCTEGVPV